jgi:TonB family protein
MTPLLLVWVLHVAQHPLLPSARLILLDGSGRPPRESADGTFTLKKSSGALVSEELFTDFTLAFDVAMEKDTQVALMLRANDVEGSRLLGPTVQLPAPTVPGAWRRVEAVADGKRLGLTIDGIPLVRSESAPFAGLIGLYVRKGKAEFRGVTIAPRDRPLEAMPGLITEKDLKARGGTSPKLLREVKPSYTSNAMRAKVQGIVTMEAVVMADGSIGAVRVIRSLHRELDAVAVGTVRLWKFAPARLEGKPIASRVEIEMQFTLK